MDSAPPGQPVAPARSNIYALTSVIRRIPASSLFAVGRPLEVELGSGDGSFLIAYASKCPDRNFMGVERLLGRLNKTNRKSLRLRLENVRLIRIEASYFLEWLLPLHCLEALHIYFPDPWPKRKHRRNRLINERFPELAHRVLKPGGSLHLRTDDTDYSNQMLEVMASDPRFRAVQIPASLLEITTDFEADFLRNGCPIHRWSFQKHPDAPAPVPAPSIPN